MYRGFPLLGEILQGLLWVVFGHIQSSIRRALRARLAVCFAQVFLRFPGT
jgi:hypothetical protein